jgi:hypothetical protein
LQKELRADVNVDASEQSIGIEENITKAQWPNISLSTGCEKGSQLRYTSRWLVFTNEDVCWDSYQTLHFLVVRDCSMIRYRVVRQPGLNTAVTGRFKINISNSTKQSPFGEANN